MMWHWMVAWRSEILTVLTFAVSWFIIVKIWVKPFWATFLSGLMVGLCVEYMTEPEWTYHMQFYIWRDISPFVVIGWGINFTWVILISEKVCCRIFGEPSASKQIYRLFLSDMLVGVPYFLVVELIGLHLLKVWQYNAILEWVTIIPIIQYPIEGLIAIVLFTAVFPWMIRYWQLAFRKYEERQNA